MSNGVASAERSSKIAARSKEQADAYIRDVAGSSPSDEIAEAQALPDAGVIDADEFETIEAHALTPPSAG